jgi:hypothetical protein
MASPGREDREPDRGEQLPGIPGTSPESLERPDERKAWWVAVLHFAAMFLLHPVVLVCLVAVAAWIIGRMLL